MVFRTTIENSAGEVEVLQIVSDVINCTQLPGTPEILKMSLSGSSISGGDELWIIGKNFMKDTKVNFSHCTPGKEEPLWTKITDPEAEYFHQTHLITKVPPFYNQSLSEPMEISVIISCGDKTSDPVPFTYTPLPSTTVNGVHSAQVTNTLPPGVSEPAVAINNQFAKTGSVSVITGTGVNTPKLRNGTNGDVTSHHHKSKKSKMDFNSKVNRRTRSVPRPNLVEEDTIFATELDFRKGGVSGDSVSQMTSFSQFSWKDSTSQAAPVVPPVRNSTEPLLTFSNSSAMRIRNSVSCSVDDESVTFTNTNTRDDLPDETSFHSPPRVDFSSSLTRDFSGAFNIKNKEEPQTPRLSFAGALMTISPPKVKSPSQTSTQNTGQFYDSSCYLPPKVETIPQTIPENSELSNVKPSQEYHEPPNVSVTKSKEDEKATISISLPTSILKDQKHFQSVIETINNTLLTKNPSEDKVEAAPAGSASVEQESPCRKITSMPVSVLSNTRKRNISSELISTQTPGNTGPYTEQMSAMSGSVATQSPYQQQTNINEQQQQLNAEFNQVLQSVMEQQNQQQQQQNSGNISNMDWTPELRGSGSGGMDWSNTVVSTGTLALSTASVVISSQQYMSTTTVPVLSIPDTVNYSIGNTGQTVTFVNQQAILSNTEAVQVNVSAVTNTGTMFITSTPVTTAPVMTCQSSGVLTTPTVSIGSVTGPQTISNCIANMSANMSVPVEEFLTPSPAQSSFTNYNSPLTAPGSVSNPSSVEQVAASDPLLFEV